MTDYSPFVLADNFTTLSVINILENTGVRIALGRLGWNVGRPGEATSPRVGNYSKIYKGYTWNSMKM